MSLFKTFRGVTAVRAPIARFQPSTFTLRRTFADRRIEEVTQAAGEAKETNPKVYYSDKVTPRLD